MPVTPPVELLDLPANGQLVTRVTAWEEGTATIRPASAPEGKEVVILRVHVPPEDKGTAPAYWDVSATTLHPTLRGLLPLAIRDRRWVRIVKFGVAPRARFSAELLPIGYPGPAVTSVRG
jgi:hypothetical protein